jgi:small-conductance mechanosensitive channel
VRSELYYAIFDALEKAGIEIPFPQRDLHVRSGLVWPEKAGPSS